MTDDQILRQLHGRLIVSCQAYPGEPLRNPSAMTQMAQSAVIGGAAGIRAQGIEDIMKIRAHVDVPLIGLWKIGEDGVYITPTLQSAVACAEAGADIVALDGTRRPRPDGLTLSQTVEELRARVSPLVMADVGSLDDALHAVDAGVDIVSTTLAGYTHERKRTVGPDFSLLEQIVSAVDRPVYAEGRIHTPQQAADAMSAGADAVVVGTAITHPASITSWFAASIRAGNASVHSEG